MMKFAKFYIIALISAAVCSCTPQADTLSGTSGRPEVPVLTLKSDNPVLKIVITRTDTANYTVEKTRLSLDGTTNIGDITAIRLYLAAADGTFSTDSLLGDCSKIGQSSVINSNFINTTDTLTIWVSVELRDSIDLKNRVNVTCKNVVTSEGAVTIAADSSQKPLRTGVALRQHMQDGVNTSRIPGITTSKNGTLIAVYDARRESDRDLQGDMDICINRSTDGGRTWMPMQVVLDMGTWGGLSQRYNGVSDGCILSDDNTGDLYVIGLWMHGILDPKDGRWIEGLTDTSTVWNHQWRSFGSQPGYDVRRSSQFLISKSTDDGLTWSQPRNITTQVKNEKWWLLAPAPGHGITLSDGTLVFPTEGRDHTGLQFSTITWSKDGGQTWTTGAAAYTNTNECMAVELTDGSIMLNMRERSNRNRMEGNGRAIAVTKDLGQTWTEHPTSRNALIEPACMASIHRHAYTDNSGQKRTALFFLNPSSKTSRNTFTLKTSLDDGNTWPQELWLLLDELNGSGYSCITSIDEHTIGVLYEGSGCDLVFQQIDIRDILKK